MSHTATIKKVAISDISALRQAVAELNHLGVSCSLRENEKPRAWSATQAGMNTPAPYVLHLDESPYDVAFYLSEDNKTYEARTDFFQGKVAKLLGVEGTEPECGIGKLLNLYSTKAALGAALKQGYSCVVNKDSYGLTTSITVNV